MSPVEDGPMITQRSTQECGHLRRLTIVAAATVTASVLLPLAPVAAAPWVGSRSAQTATEHPQDRVIVGIRRGDKVEASQKVKDAGANVVDYNPSGRFLVVEAPMPLEALAAEIESADSVVYVEPDVQVTAADIVPTDSQWNALWGMQRVQAPAAWKTTTGSKDIVVGVADSGVDYTHEDLASQMWVNEDEDPTTPGDDDANGWTNDVHGVDCVNDDGDPMDDNSHGTHVAGTIGSAANNGVGIAGVAWNVRIMALKFLGADNRGWMSDAIECLYYAIDNGAHVTNHSWYGTDFSQALYDAIAVARDHDQLLIAAAGNEAADNDSLPHYPASFDLDNIISVAATDGNDQLAGFSNHGVVSVDLAAPGVGIISTVPGGYASYSGTSMAAPHVTGGVALLLAADPSLQDDAARLRNALLDNVDQIAGLDAAIASGGRLNLGASLASHVPTEPPAVHVHGLKGHSISLGRRGWKASMTVTVVDQEGLAAAGATVSVSWSAGRDSSCITSVNGTCSTTSIWLRKTTHSQAFGSIENVTALGFSYDVTSNVEPAASGVRITMRAQ